MGAARPLNSREFMWKTSTKTFQATQKTQQRFLTLDHSCKIFFDKYLLKYSQYV